MKNKIYTFLAPAKILYGSRPIAFLVIAALTASLTITKVNAGGSPSIGVLLGSWGGGGILKLTDGSSKRIRCNGYYTGGDTQLGMVIRCTGGDQKIEMRSKLSVNASNVSGSWEERTYNAVGSINGTITSNTINMSISGSVVGSMNVKYSRSRQSVSINTNNIGMRSVNITLSRQ